MSRKINLLICGGLLLLAAALCTVVYHFWDEHRASDSAENVVRQIEEQITAPGFSQEKEQENPVESVSPDPFPQGEETPTLEVDGHQYIGTLELPSVGVTVPVMSEWSYSKLKLSPCRFSGCIYQDDLIIAGHNYSAHFACLKDLNVGDEIIFTDAEGRLFSYVVSSQQRLGSMELEVLTAGDWDLTLFTCTTDRTHRVTVRCERVEYTG